MDTGLLRGLATLLAMAAFLGVAWWAWRGRHRARFEEAARLPLEEDAEPTRERRP